MSEAQIDEFVAQQPGLDATDARMRNRIALFLNMHARSERKKVWMEEMFERYGVQIALAAPPEPPLEEIYGPLAPALGRLDAPVTVVSFSDYQCPFCRRMLDTLVALHRAYPDTVQVVYRHYPLHDGAGALAEAALCAGDQGRFWDYHLELFAPEQIDPSQSFTIAERLGMDIEAFRSCLVSGMHTQQVQDDFAEGRRLQISGTPHQLSSTGAGCAAPFRFRSSSRRSKMRSGALTNRPRCPDQGSRYVTRGARRWLDRCGRPQKCIGGFTVGEFGFSATVACGSGSVSTRPGHSNSRS